MGSTHLSVYEDRDNDLAAALCVACDVSRELLNVGDNDGLPLGGCGTANALSEPDFLARGLAVEGSEQKKLILR